MKINKAYFITGLVLALGLGLGPAARADEANEATTITFSTPVQIPGQVLPAGTYLFKLADDGADPNVVQIFNSAGTKIYATLLTASSDRQVATDDTTITLAEQGSGNPEALMKWYYPGSLIGHEFMYSGREEKQLAQDKHQTIAVSSNTTNVAAQSGD
jgi:hypothetical protein